MARRDRRRPRRRARASSPYEHEEFRYMSDADPQVTALLARFVLETKIEAIPEIVRREGMRSLVNIIGCALGGSRHDAVNKAWAARVQCVASAPRIGSRGRPMGAMPNSTENSPRQQEGVLVRISIDAYLGPFAVSRPSAMRDSGWWCPYGMTRRQMSRVGGPVRLEAAAPTGGHALCRAGVLRAAIGRP